MVAPLDEAPSAKPAIGAIVTGGLIALLGFVAAFSQGMATAPSDVAAIFAMSGMMMGCALALLGIASIWLPRVRHTARILNYVALGVLVAGFVVDRAVRLLG